jgi:hypothetical protein
MSSSKYVVGWPLQNTVELNRPRYRWHCNDLKHTVINKWITLYLVTLYYRRWTNIWCFFLSFYEDVDRSWTLCFNLAIVFHIDSVSSIMVTCFLWAGPNVVNEFFNCFVKVLIVAHMPNNLFVIFEI